MMKREVNLPHPAKFPRKMAFKMRTLAWVDMLERGRRSNSKNAGIEIEAGMGMSMLSPRGVWNCLTMFIGWISRHAAAWMLTVTCTGRRAGRDSVH